MILPPLLSDGEAEISLLSAVLLPLLCGFDARGSEHQIRGSECDVRHIRSHDSLVRSERSLARSSECWFRSERSLIRSSEYQFRSGDFFENHQSSLSINGGIFSKITPSLFTIKEGSTSFPKPLSPQGTGDVPTALLGAQTASL